MIWILLGKKEKVLDQFWPSVAAGREQTGGPKPDYDEIRRGTNMIIYAVDDRRGR
jgi:hypothetical protein